MLLLAMPRPSSNQHDVIVQLQALNSNIATEAVVIDGKPPKVKTFNGISKDHCFRFPEKNLVSAFYNSDMLDNPHNFFYV